MEQRQGNSGSNTAIVALVALFVIALLAFGAYTILNRDSNGGGGAQSTEQPGEILPLPTTAP